MRMESSCNNDVPIRTGKRHWGSESAFKLATRGMAPDQADLMSLPIPPSDPGSVHSGNECRGWIAERAREPGTPVHF
jgi:hypothetical protein